MKKICLLHCPVCKEQMDDEVINVCNAAYRFIAKEIKKDHPEWEEKNGACKKCVDYYEKIYLYEQVR